MCRGRPGRDRPAPRAAPGRDRRHRDPAGPRCGEPPPGSAPIRISGRTRRLPLVDEPGDPRARRVRGIARRRRGADLRSRSRRGRKLRPARARPAAVARRGRRRGGPRRRVLVGDDLRGHAASGLAAEPHRAALLRHDRPAGPGRCVRRGPLGLARRRRARDGAGLSLDPGRVAEDEHRDEPIPGGRGRSGPRAAAGAGTPAGRNAAADRAGPALARDRRGAWCCRR